MLDSILYNIKKFIPKRLFQTLAPTYHFILAFIAAILYRFPSRKINVVVVTGTKGKTSTVELIGNMLEKSGHKIALSSTIHFKIGGKTKNNLYKMTLPGRTFLQRFLRDAVKAKCEYAVIEMTSEGAKLFRHKFVFIDSLVFTNLTPEHIESHGSFEKYLNAKLSIAKSLEKSHKKNKVIVSNIDDRYGEKFLDIKVANKYRYSLRDARPYSTENGIDFMFDGLKIHSSLLGKFNLYNILAAATYAKSQNINIEDIGRAINDTKIIPGRGEYIKTKIDSNLSRQNFNVIVDYAHTADSMRQLYEAFPNNRKICVFGATGGGRDKCKRKKMGEVADMYCDKIILTNDDPYDEDPIAITKDILLGIKNTEVKTIIDRRDAIKQGLLSAKSGDVVLISGKGTDPYLMLKNNTKIPWSDADIAREELNNILDVTQ